MNSFSSILSIFKLQSVKILLIWNRGRSLCVLLIRHENNFLSFQGFTLGEIRWIATQNRKLLSPDYRHSPSFPPPLLLSLLCLLSSLSFSLRALCIFPKIFKDNVKKKSITRDKIEMVSFRFIGKIPEIKIKIIFFFAKYFDIQLNSL